MIYNNAKDNQVNSLLFPPRSMDLVLSFWFYSSIAECYGNWTTTMPRETTSIGRSIHIYRFLGQRPGEILLGIPMGGEESYYRPILRRGGDKEKTNLLLLRTTGLYARFSYHRGVPTDCFLVGIPPIIRGSHSLFRQSFAPLFLYHK